MSNISMKALLEAGVHFGHQTRRWNPKMAKFIFGTRNKIHIVDLQKTVKELKKSYKFVRDSVCEGKSVLFVGTKKQAQTPIKEEALRCGAFFVSDRWLGGTLTNFDTLKRSIARLKELTRMKTEGVFDILSKKESSKLEKERFRMEKSLEGIKDMKKLPDLLFIIDPSEETTAVAEARKLKIPIVAICDTNCDPDIISHPIPGNDDAIRAVKLFCSIMGDAVLEGKGMSEKQANASAAAGELTAVDLSAPVAAIDTAAATTNQIPGSEVIA
ncbi:MAG: 30S ribosomal protein S2 [Elusimicrobia bacterium]|nr:30S ribosomal protein S2 [Elusimicrobiota bacterium]